MGALAFPSSFPENLDFAFFPNAKLKQKSFDLRTPSFLKPGCITWRVKASIGAGSRGGNLGTETGVDRQETVSGLIHRKPVNKRGRGGGRGAGREGWAERRRELLSLLSAFIKTHLSVRVRATGHS